MSTKEVERDKTGYLFERSPLDPALLALTEDELSFFKMHTGIMDEQELQEHILQIQSKAYNKFPYPCIRRFCFTNLRISWLRDYAYVLHIGQRRENAILLDVGCCFGNDIRRVIADGYPMEGVVASDLRRDFWDLGHQLFKSSPATFPVPFIEADILDSATLPPGPPSYTIPATKPPQLVHLGNSLTPLRHHVSVIHAALLFHLFSKDQQLQVAQKLAALLSPIPGSIILGRHIGKAVAGIKTNNRSGDREMYCHSPESWRAMWDGVVFQPGSVEVYASLSDAERPAAALDRPLKVQDLDKPKNGDATQWLEWSVKRVDMNSEFGNSL